MLAQFASRSSKPGVAGSSPAGGAAKQFLSRHNLPQSFCGSSARKERTGLLKSSVERAGCSEVLVRTAASQPSRPSISAIARIGCHVQRRKFGRRNRPHRASPDRQTRWNLHTQPATVGDREPMIAGKSGERRLALSLPCSDSWSRTIADSGSTGAESSSYKF